MEGREAKRETWISMDHAGVSSTQSDSHTAVRFSWPVVSCTNTEVLIMEKINTAAVLPASSVLYIPSALSFVFHLFVIFVHIYLAVLHLICWV